MDLFFQEIRKLYKFSQVLVMGVLRNYKMFEMIEKGSLFFKKDIMLSVNLNIQIIEKR